MSTKRPEEKNIVQRLAEEFNSYRQQHALAASELRTVQDEIAALEGEASAIRAAPVTKEDFVEALLVRLKALAAPGPEWLQNMLDAHKWRGGIDHSRIKSYVNADRFRWDHIQNAKAGSGNLGEWTEKAIFCASHPNNFNLNGSVDITGMLILFGPAIAASVKERFDAITWPYPDAQPTSVRIARLAEIDARLEQLRAREAELQGAMAQVTSLVEG